MKQKNNDIIISNVNRTKWSPSQSVIMKVIKKPATEYDYRLKWTTQSIITN